MRLIDLAGQRFGRWTVLEKAPIHKGQTYWLCACDCGTRRAVHSSSLRRGDTTSCGCLRCPEIAGERFGKLVALRSSGVDANGFRVYACRCDCGSETVKRSSHLTSGEVTSCGCGQRLHLAGLRFGRLLVIEEAGRRREGGIQWRCRCDCGRLHTTAGSLLVAGRTKTCGRCPKHTFYRDADVAECSSCGQRKPHGEMVTQHDRPTTRCKACHSEGERQRREDPLYRARSRAMSAAWHRRKKTEDPEYVEREREKRRERYRAKVATPEGRAYVRSWFQNRKARLLRAGGSYDEGHVRAMYAYQGGVCTYCGVGLGDDYHVDHKVPLSRGGSNWPANLHLTCETCNKSKGTRTHREYVAWRTQGATSVHVSKHARA